MSTIYSKLFTNEINSLWGLTEHALYFSVSDSVWANQNDFMVDGVELAYDYTEDVIQEFAWSRAFKDDLI